MAKQNKFKVCDSCETKISYLLELCSSCGSSNFRPEFVEKKRMITKNFSINVGPKFNNPKKKVLTLYKWFPGKDSWHVNIYISENGFRI